MIVVATGNAARKVGPGGMAGGMILIAAAAVGVIAIADMFGTTYAYTVSYTVIQYLVLATAWNILGGYAGYVNFGMSAFFAIGVYTSVVVQQVFGNTPLLQSMLIAGVLGGIAGLALGAITLRINGVFFSIATLAVSIVALTVVNNWDFVGGARGTFVMRPAEVPIFGSYIRLLLCVMLMLAVVTTCIVWRAENSWIGHGLAAVRSDEVAAECCGVPTMRLKLIAAAASGALISVVGAPFPFVVGYIDLSTVFGLHMVVITMAMCLIGGIGAWWGPVIGALLLGSLDQYLTVTSSAVPSLLLLGILMVVFMTVAPGGLVGIIRKHRERTQ